VARSTAKNPSRRRGKTASKSGRENNPAVRDVEQEGQSRRNGGWREIEARREKAALRASLADVWDEDFDLDEEILAELDHTAEFFTTQEETSEEPGFEDEDEDEYYEEDEA
jgi:hypothetical protein